MPYTIVRGGAIMGIRLCQKCAMEYYEQNMDKKPSCQICGCVVKDGIQLTLCRYCSAETGVCQGCGTQIGADFEAQKKLKKKRKTVEQET